MPAPNAQNEFNPSTHACRLTDDDPGWKTVIASVDVSEGSRTTREMLRAIRQSGMFDARQVLAAGEGNRWVWYKGMWHVGRPTSIPVETGQAALTVMTRDPQVEALRERAHSLSESGMSYHKIAKELGVRPSTAWYYVRDMRRRRA